MVLVLLTLSLALLAGLARATTSLTFIIPVNPPILPNPAGLLPPATHATLTTSGAILSAPLSKHGTFTFHHLPRSDSDRSYLLDIHAREYIFAPYRVDVAANGTVLGIWETFRGNAWSNKGNEKYVHPTEGNNNIDAPQKVVVEARVVARRPLYEERPKFSPLSLFKNPMILLALFAMISMFGLPKLIENMDPEMREEFERQSRNTPMPGAAGAQAPSFDLAGWMAGASSGSSSSTGREDVRRRR